ncbi:MAG: hypothetical protein HC842_01280 [Cytophagales bacterium]|nr:hypothetical protein [Cytophagales bacterium]
MDLYPIKNSQNFIRFVMEIEQNHLCQCPTVQGRLVFGSEVGFKVTLSIINRTAEGPRALQVVSGQVIDELRKNPGEVESRLVPQRTELLHGLFGIGPKGI